MSNSSPTFKQQSIDAHKAVNDALKADPNGNTVYSFNPELSPEQKKAQAEENTQQVKTVLKSASVKPTIKSTPDDKALDTTPGSFTNKSQNGIPEWYSVGWTAFSTLPNPGDEKAIKELSQKLGPDTVAELYKGSRAQSGAGDQNDLLAQIISDKYYGKWFHNGAALGAAVVSTWLLTMFGFGLLSCLIVGAFLATYYQTSIRRTRRAVRDDIEREMMLTHLDTDAESVDWMNLFLARFWLIYEPILSAQIIGTADTILAQNTPSYLDSIRLSSFTLGTKAPRIESIKTYPKTEPNVVCMDWKLSFTPNDILDLSARDLQSKVNPKIVLTIRVGKGMVGAGIPILLEDVAFSALLRVKIKMFNEFPHVKTVEASFLEKPYFDYVLKPVGGETFGFDINNIPGLESFVKDQVHSTLGPMMYSPNVYTLDVAGMMAGTSDKDSANGVLALTIYSASQLKGTDIFGSLDPYITFHIGSANQPEVGHTSAHENTSSPKWNETYFILLNNLYDTLFLQVMDRNSGRKDSEIGIASYDLKEIVDSDNISEGLNLSVLRSGKPVGEVKCDMRYFPVSRAEKQEDGSVVPPEESNSGILRFTINQCKELGGGSKKSGFGLPLIAGSGVDVDTYAILTVNGKENMRTPVFKHSINPRWDKSVEIFIADKTKLDLGVKILNSRDFGDDDVVGQWSSSLTKFEDQIVNEKMDWWNLQNGSGKIHLSMQWKPVAMTGFSEGLGHGAYRPPVGVVRVELFGATDLKNVEALTGGKSDPYVRILSGMQIRGQTEYVEDNLNPEWNTAIFVPVHSVREDLIFEVMDWNDIQKDKSLGIHEFTLKSIVKESKTDYGQAVYEALEPVDSWVDLMGSDRRRGKGRIHFSAAFYPTMALAKAATATDKASSTITEGENKIANTKDKASGDPSDLEHPEKDLHGEVIQYSKDGSKIDLLAYDAGVLSVTIYKANIPTREKVTADILLDSNDPQYRTAQIKGSNLPFNETGDAFVKEMDFSRLVVRIKKVDENKDDSCIGYWENSVKDIVRNLQDLPTSSDESSEEVNGTDYKLLNCQGGTIRLAFKYTPVVQFKLDPRDSLENQGNLSVTAIRATNLRAVDRSGTSDPYVVFTLDGAKVFKTQVYKKQLNPIFTKDESFVLAVPGRIGANLEAAIYDWDQFGKGDLIAKAKIPFTDDVLESFLAKEFEIPLEGNSSLTVRLLWQPQLLPRKRADSNVLTATTRMLTSVPGAGVHLAGDVVGTGLNVGTQLASGIVGTGLDAGGMVLGTGTKIVGGGVSAIGSGIRGIGKFGKKDKTVAKPLSEYPIPPEPRTHNEVHDHSDVQTYGSSGFDSPVDNRSLRQKSIFDGHPGDNPISIKITIIAGRNLHPMGRENMNDAYVRVRIGKRAVYKTQHISKTNNPEWNGSFNVNVSKDKSVLNFKVKDRHLFAHLDGGDVSLNMSEILVSPDEPFDQWVELSPKDSGSLHIRIEAIS
ncbi:C2 domain-containing protein [Phycomyces blakesleeanus]|uniref:C2 domain-containing protein n=1 Tax=Phycomyces blakesleeanus TaxID=4837 RepID=A0ABR3B8L0_PHYBL